MFEFFFYRNSITFMYFLISSINLRELFQHFFLSILFSWYDKRLLRTNKMLNPFFLTNFGLSRRHWNICALRIQTCPKSKIMGRIVSMWRNCVKILGGGRNFEQTHVKRSIFRNLRIANVKSYEKFSFSIF